MGCSSSKKCDLSACNSCPWGCTCVNWSTSFDGDDSVCEETLDERLQCGVNIDEASGHMHCQCGRLIWGSILLVVVLTSFTFYFRARRTNKPQNYKFLGTCLGFGLTCLINVCIPTVELPTYYWIYTITVLVVVSLTTAICLCCSCCYDYMASTCMQEPFLASNSSFEKNFKANVEEGPSPYDVSTAPVAAEMPEVA